MVKWFGALALSAVAFAAVAEEQEVSFDVYGDWRAIVTQVSGGEETWRTCRAVTGGDGDPVLEIDARQYDAGPPVFYPPVTFRERAPRGYDTLLQDGDTVTFLFDDGDNYQATASVGADEEGFRVAETSPLQDDTLYVLQGMQRAGQLDIIVDGDVAYSASLSGFTAAYGKIAEACAFSTVGVITPLAAGKDETGDTEDVGEEGGLLSADHGAWRVQADEFPSDGTMVRECYAYIPADGLRHLSVSHNSLEATPPDSYPPLILSGSVAETATPMAQSGALIQFAFSTGLILPGDVMTDLVVEGEWLTDLAVKPGYRDLALREMARATTLAVYANGEEVYQTELHGFAEAYADMARVCEFSATGVLD